MQIANIVGCPSHAPMLVVEEYDLKKVRMERFLLGKEKGDTLQDLFEGSKNMKDNG